MLSLNVKKNMVTWHKRRNSTKVKYQQRHAMPEDSMNEWTSFPLPLFSIYLIAGHLHAHTHIHTTIHLLPSSHTHAGQTWSVYPHIPRQTVTMSECVCHCVFVCACACVCVCPVDKKRGHSVQGSDDWAADTGKKEADRRRNKERERCRSLPNCQWVIALDHTQTHTHTHTHTHTQNEPPSNGHYLHVAGAETKYVCVSVYGLSPLNLFDVRHSSHAHTHEHTHAHTHWRQSSLI